MSVSMSNKNEPTSLDELVDFTTKTVNAHYEQTKSGLDGSLLSYLLRQSYPTLDYSKLGLSRMGDIVRAAIHRGLVDRMAGITHLVLLPSLRATNAPLQASAEAVTPRLAYVRADLWRAMVMSDPGVVDFLNRRTGELVKVPISEGTRLRQARVNDTLVEVSRVTTDQQLGWLKEFLDSRKETFMLTEHEETLLKTGLRSLGSEISRDWTQLRSRRVVEEVRNWASRHGIAEDVVLMPRDRKEKIRAVVPSVHAEVANDGVRRATLAAIQEMSPEELETCVRIPLRLVLRHFAPK